MEEEAGTHKQYNTQKWNHVLEDILTAGAATKEPVSNTVHHLPGYLSWWKIAVVLLLAAGTCAVMLEQRPVKQPAPLTKKAVYENNVPPGREGASLKLADGKTILIDSVADGLIAIQGKDSIYKQKGKIIYKGTGTEPVYNEISTVRGRQWVVALPDGTIVYLNAASSIRYPLNFARDQRTVEMAGEAYFTVVHDESRPFRVKTGNRQLVEDKGTEFNINAYEDEASIKTTLISGAANIISSDEKVTLVPGQQASLRDDSQHFQVYRQDLASATAWKDGFFSFHDADIQMVMRQLARWYDVEVEYSNGIPKQLFEGEIERSFPLATVLEILEKTNVHFRIVKDRKILILP